MGRALVPRTELRDDDLAGALTFSLMMSLAMYVLVFGCAGVGARAMRAPELVNVLSVVGLTLLLIPFRSVPMAILERRLQLKRAATIGWASSIIQDCVVLTLVLTGFGYWALILGYMVPRFLEVPVYARQASWLPRLRWPGRWSNPIVSYGIHFTGSAALLIRVPECRLRHRGTTDGPDRTRSLFLRVHVDLDPGGKDCWRRATRLLSRSSVA